MAKSYVMICPKCQSRDVNIDSSNPAQETTNIGVIAPMTGKLSAWGENAVNAVNLAYDELPENEKSKFKLIFEDDQYDVPKTVTAYNKLKNVDNIGAVITLGAGASNAIAPLAEADGIVMIALSTHADVTKNRNFVFKHFLVPETEAKVFHAEVERRGYQKIALFSTQQQGVLAIKNAVLKVSNRSEIYTMDYVFNPGEQDFRSTILKAKGADAYALFMLPHQVGTIAKQIREAGITAPIIGMGTIEDRNAILAAEGALEGTWFSAPDGPGEQMKHAHIEKYGKLPGLFSGNAYDAVNILFKNFEGDVVNNIKNLKDYKGTMGDNLNVDETNTIQSLAVLKIIQNGEVVLQ